MGKYKHLVNGSFYSKTLAEWCELSGLKSSTVRQRFYVYKWPIDDCFQPLKFNYLGNE